MLKRFVPTSLMGRSLLILAMPILIVQIVTSYVFFNRHWDRMIQRLCDSVVGELSYYIEEIETNKDYPGEFEAIANRAIRHTDMLLQFQPNKTLSAPRHVIANHGWENMVADILTPILERKMNRPYALKLDFKDKWVYLDIQIQGGVLNVQMPERRVFSSSGYIYLLWVLGSAFILLIIAIAFMRNQVRPIRKLSVAAQRFGRGAELSHFKPEGAREVRQAGQAFLEMAKNIRRQMEQRSLMLAGVSHDLRTPITRLRLALSMFEKNEDTQAMESDLREMEQMISGYLDYVRGVSEEELETIAVNEFIDNIIKTQIRAGQAIECSALPDMKLETKPLALSRCLKNIIVNAQRYAEKAWVNVRAQDKQLVITIEDNGAGIDPSQYDNVFRPFFRTDRARSLSKGSVGLGLSIARDVIEGLGGEIKLDKSQSHGGLSVQITLAKQEL